MGVELRPQVGDDAPRQPAGLPLARRAMSISTPQSAIPLTHTPSRERSPGLITSSTIILVISGGSIWAPTVTNVITVNTIARAR